jgi:branched-chain amino acid transport system permease protein
MYLVSAFLLCAFYVFCRRLIGSPFGMVLRGSRSNRQRMEVLGFPTLRYRLAAFVISGMMCGVSGILLANLTEFVAPAYMDWERSGDLIVMVVVGGMGTLIGPIFGAAAYLGLQEALSGFTPHWQVVVGPLLVLRVLLVRRGVHKFRFKKRAPVLQLAGDSS